MSNPPPPPRASKPSVAPVRERAEGSSVSKRASAAPERPSGPPPLPRARAAPERPSAPAAPVLTRSSARVVEAPAAPAIEPRDTSRVSVREPPEHARSIYAATDFEHSVHLDAQGNILAGNGKLEELAALAAYAAQLASLVGRQLGFGEVTGMEVTLATGVIMLHRDAQGEIVSLKPQPRLNLVQLRKQLNL